MRQDRVPEDALFQLGLKVAELRRNLGLTQAELCERHRVPLRYLQHIEAGEVNVTFLTLVRLAKALEVAPGRLCAAPRSKKKAKRGRPRPVR